MIIDRGDICITDLNPVLGSEQSGIRPVIRIQNNEISQYSTTIVIIPLTTNLRRAELPSCITIFPIVCGLNEKSVALCHQIKVIDKSIIKKNIGKISITSLFELESTLLYTLGFDE